jgi:hypothetical protein
MSNFRAGRLDPTPLRLRFETGAAGFPLSDGRVDELRGIVRPWPPARSRGAPTSHYHPGRADPSTNRNRHRPRSRLDTRRRRISNASGASRFATASRWTTTSTIQSAARTEARGETRTRRASCSGPGAGSRRRRAESRRAQRSCPCLCIHTWVPRETSGSAAALRRDIVYARQAAARS